MEIKLQVKENIDMGTRRRRVRTRKEEVVEQEPEELDEVEEVDVEDFEEEDEDEVEEVAPVKKKKAAPAPPRKPVTAAATAKSAKAVKMPRGSNTHRKTAAESGDLDDVVEDAETPSAIKAAVQDSNFFALLELLQKGDQLILQRMTNTRWIIKVATKEEVEKQEKKLRDVVLVDSTTAGKTTKGLGSGNKYWATVLSDEFKDWQDVWNQMSKEERIKEAKKKGAKWVEHETMSINLMRASNAYREHMNIPKYKPLYEDSSVRRRLRDHGIYADENDVIEETDDSDE